MKCTLPHFKDVIDDPSGGVQMIVCRKPVECGGEIMPKYEYLPDDSRQCDGYYCEKCGVRYEKLPEAE